MVCLILARSGLETCPSAPTDWHLWMIRSVIMDENMITAMPWSYGSSLMVLHRENPELQGISMSSTAASTKSVIGLS